MATSSLHHHRRRSSHHPTENGVSSRELRSRREDGMISCERDSLVSPSSSCQRNDDDDDDESFYSRGLSRKKRPLDRDHDCNKRLNYPPEKATRRSSSSRSWNSSEYRHEDQHRYRGSHLCPEARRSDSYIDRHDGMSRDGRRESHRRSPLPSHRQQEEDERFRSSSASRSSSRSASLPRKRTSTTVSSSSSSPHRRREDDHRTRTSRSSLERRRNDASSSFSCLNFDARRWSARSDGGGGISRGATVRDGSSASALHGRDLHAPLKKRWVPPPRVLEQQQQRRHVAAAAAFLTCAEQSTDADQSVSTEQQGRNDELFGIGKVSKGDDKETSSKRFFAHSALPGGDSGDATTLKEAATAAAHRGNDTMPEPSEHPLVTYISVPQADSSKETTLFAAPPSLGSPTTTTTSGTKDSIVPCVSFPPLVSEESLSSSSSRVAEVSLSSTCSLLEVSSPVVLPIESPQLLHHEHGAVENNSGADTTTTAQHVPSSSSEPPCVPAAVTECAEEPGPVEMPIAMCESNPVAAEENSPAESDSRLNLPLSCNLETSCEQSGGDMVVVIPSAAPPAEDSSDSSDTDTDEEEVMRWGRMMFGITAPPPVLPTKDTTPASDVKAQFPPPTSYHQHESSRFEFSDNDSDVEFAPAVMSLCERVKMRRGKDVSSVASPTKKARRKKKTKARPKGRGKEREQLTAEDIRRRKESAKPPTAEDLRKILAEDDGNCVASSTHWVRRSMRQPSRSVLTSTNVRALLDKLRSNDSDMEVLKMKKYVSDPDTPSVVIDEVLDALEENTNCQALYIQNYNEGVRDEQMLHLLSVLQLPTCKIWCLNIGELYNIKRKTWKRFAKGLKKTKITHMYASEHTISTSLKDEIRDTIRQNRTKHNMHIDPENLDVIVRCTHNWWNPINAKVLRPYLKNRGYEHMLYDKEAQGLKGSMSEPTDDKAPSLQRC